MKTLSSVGLCCTKSYPGAGEITSPLRTMSTLNNGKNSANAAETGPHPEMDQGKCPSAHATETGSHPKQTLGNLSVVFDPKVTKVILDESSERVVLNDRLRKRIEVGLKSTKRFSRQQLRDLKQDMLQDGICDHIADMTLNISQFLDRLGIHEYRVFFESLLHLIADLAISSSLSQRLSALLHFIRHLVPDAVPRCTKYVNSLFQSSRLQDESTTPLFGEKFFGDLGELFKHSASFLASETWKALQNILTYVLAIFVGMHDGMEESTLRNLIPELCRPISFTGSALLQLFKHIVFVINQGYQYVKTGSWTSFCYEQNSVVKWQEKLEEARLMNINLNSPDPTLRKSPKEVYNRYLKLVEEGKEISKFLTPAQKKFFSVSFRQAVDTCNDLHNSIVGTKFRRAPLAVLLNGDPSVGKTSFTDHICDFFAKYRGFEYNEDTKYTRNFADQYWSGAKSTTRIIVLDDLGFENPNKMTSLSESSLKEIIQIINNNILLLNMADLSEKGKVFCMPELVVGTTNCKHLNAISLFETPYAVLRRFEYVISIEPRPECRTPAGGLCVNFDGPQQELADMMGEDWWHIRVQKPHPMRDTHEKLLKHVQFQDVFETTSLAEFRKEFKKLIDKHEMIQDAIMKSYADKRLTKYCDDCFRPTNLCECGPRMQDGVDEGARQFGWWRWFLSWYLPIHYTKVHAIGIVYENPWMWLAWYNLSMQFAEIVFLIIYPFIASLPTLALYLSFKTYQQGMSFAGLGAMAYQWVPWEWKKKIVLWWLRSRAPQWLKNKWSYVNLCQGISILAACYSLYFWSTTFYSVCKEEEGYRKEEEELKAKMVEEQPGEEEPLYDDQIQGAALSALSQPVPDVYYNDVEKSISLDFGAKTLSWKALSEADVIERVSAQVVRLQCHDVMLGTKKKKKGVGLFVRGQVLITNSHLFKSGHTFVVNHPKFTHPLKSVVDDSDIVISEPNDLMIIRFRNVPPFADILDLFPKVPIKDLRCSVSILTRDDDCKMVIHCSKYCKWKGRDTLSHELFGTLTFEQYMAFGINSTQNGDCGSPYLVHTPLGPSIVAIHQAINAECVSGVSLTKPMIESLIPSESKIQGGSLVRPTCKFTLTNWSMNSNLRRIPNAHFTIFGTSQRRFPAKSKVRKSILYESCIEQGMEDIYAAPKMRDREVWINQAIPMVEREIEINHKLLDEARDLFIDEVLNKIPAEEFQEIFILSEHQSLNGVDSMKYVDKIPRKTSAGFPFNCSKSKFLTLNDDGTATLDEEKWEDVRAVDAILRDGQRAMPVFMGSLKDEVVTKEKREKKKTRVFTGSPLSFSLLMRKYLLTINAFIQKRRSQFECCVGIDALGPEWHDLAVYLKEFSDLYVAGDYKAYDKTMTPDLILAAGEIVLEMCKRARYEDQDLQAVESIFFDIAFPVTNFDGDIIMTCGAEPSGHPLTVIVNSLVGSLLMRMAFVNLFPRESFKQNVRLLVYGDDNLLSTKKGEFSHCYIADFLQTQGLTYTMAEKGAESRPFVTFDECSFLKRTFEWHEELQRYVGPLAESSMRKSLMYYLPKGSISEENWAVEVMDTYCREMFFHGRDKFNMARKWCLSLVEKLDLGQCVRTTDFADFDTLVNWYVEKQELFQQQPLEIRSFQQLQCGCFDDEVTLCPFCGQEDCSYPLADAVMCHRCKRCRTPHFMWEDKMFFGCIYCETEYPLMCDCCTDEKVAYQYFDDDKTCAFFYCGECMYLLQPRTGHVVPMERIYDPDRRDPRSITPTVSGGCRSVAVARSRKQPRRTGDDVFALYETSQMTNNTDSCRQESNSRVERVSTREKWNSSHLQDGEDSIETVSFMDLQPHSVTQIPSSEEEVSDNMAMDSVSLADFLSRPVLIDTYSWEESDAPGTVNSIYPWHLFFNTATIKYKLNNWAFIKCNLHLRVVYNASPFYYGSMMLNWRPIHGLSESLLHDDSTSNVLIPFSQMPGRTMIEPQTPEDQEIQLPFFWPANFLRVQEADDFTNMGKLYFNVINPLLSANGVSGVGITMKVYAWATDIVLSGPSVGLSMQDGTVDEYKMDGPVSKPASAIANVAARLGDIPVIGRFATATQIGATAVAHIAKLFGFTNVPVVSDQHGFQPRALPPIATTDIGFPFEKLTVDSKNELTIDHRSVGLSAIDELPIASLVQRESYLTSFDWETGDAADTVLFSSAVTPSLWDASGTSNYYLYMTPMCWLSTLFDYWRGDVIFRFRIVCSKYHRGRIKISFDPDGYAGLNVTTDQSSHLIMTKIVDISENTNVEMRIPYQQYTAWLATYRANLMTSANKQWGTSAFYHNRGNDNGNIVVSVQTVLTAPVESSTISVQVFVRGAENMDFASPTTIGIDMLTAAEIQDGELQDGEISDVPSEHKNQGQSAIVSVASGAISRPIDHLYLTYMGERIASLRVLLRRQCKVLTYAPPAESVSDYVVKTLSMNRVPSMLGFDTNGLDGVVKALTPPDTTKFNWTLPNFLSYIAPAFRGSRGSVNWSAVFDVGSSSGPLKYFTVVRNKYADKPAKTYTAATMSTTSANNKFWYINSRTSGAGALVATGPTANAANWQMPFYSKYKFTYTDSANLNNCAPSFTTGDFFTCEWSLSGSYGPTPNSAKLHFYAGAGTDFDLLYFLHVPTYGVLAALPTSS